LQEHFVVTLLSLGGHDYGEDEEDKDEQDE